MSTVLKKNNSRIGKTLTVTGLALIFTLSTQFITTTSVNTDATEPTENNFENAVQQEALTDTVFKQKIIHLFNLISSGGSEQEIEEALNDLNKAAKNEAAADTILIEAAKAMIGAAWDEYTTALDKANAAYDKYDAYDEDSAEAEAAWDEYRAALDQANAILAKYEDIKTKIDDILAEYNIDEDILVNV